MPDIVYVQTCPTVVPVPIPTGTDICTVINSTHMICETSSFFTGIPSFMSSMVGGFGYGIIVALFIGAIWYLASPEDDNK